MSPASPSEQPIIDAIVTRAASDRAFRERLLADPHHAVSVAFGVQIPADFRVKFVERDADVDALIVLPDLAEDFESTGELSELELEAVSGGHGAQASWSRMAIKIKVPRTR